MLNLAVLVTSFALALANPNHSETSVHGEYDDFDVGAYLKACKQNKKGQSVLLPSRRMIDGPYRWDTAIYGLSTDGSEITLYTRLILDFPDATDEQKKALQKKMMPILDCFTLFFRRHGIKLDLDFIPPKPLFPTSTNRVNIREKGEHGATFNMTNWAFSINKLELKEMACPTMIHEFGHMLGLWDEYDDKRGRIGASDSIMRWTYDKPDNLKFYPYHLKKMLRGLCGD